MVPLQLPNLRQKPINGLLQLYKQPNRFCFISTKKHPPSVCVDLSPVAVISSDTLTTRNDGLTEFCIAGPIFLAYKSFSYSPHAFWLHSILYGNTPHFRGALNLILMTPSRWMTFWLLH